MAAGGIYDHVGGGFARYSTDARWHVPHFEKMLYDNAQLVRVYAGAYRLTGDERLRFVAEDTLAYLQREMHPAAAAAAFSSAQDADSEGVEGRFYVWTGAELRAVLGADADAAMRLYGASDAGNWEHGVNVLERRERKRCAPSSACRPSVRRMGAIGARAPVRGARAARPADHRRQGAGRLERHGAARLRRGRPAARPRRPRRCGARAGAVSARHDAARRRLRHCWRDGTLRTESYLSDYAQVGLGLVELHAATGELDWLQARTIWPRRWSSASMSPTTASTTASGSPAGAGARSVRRRGALGHGGRVRTAAATGRRLRPQRLGAIAWQAIERQAALLEQAPSAMPALLLAHLLGEHGADLALPLPAGPLEAARAEFAPLVTLVSGAPQALPLLQDRQAGCAYLCRHGSCQLPATTLEALRGQLAQLRLPVRG
jgi:uncharacterized protein